MAVQGQLVPAAQAMVGALGLGTPHWHLTGKGQSTASLGGSRWTQLQGVRAPAPAACHKGKLRHDGFKHTSIGPAWPCAWHHNQCDTQRHSAQENSTWRHSIQRCRTQRHDIHRSTTPQSTITKGMTLKETHYPRAQYAKRHDLWRHNAQEAQRPGSTVPRGAISRGKTSKETIHRFKMHKDTQYSRNHSTQRHDIPKHNIPGYKILREAQ